jgi:hypothetical protein
MDLSLPYDETLSWKVLVIVGGRGGYASDGEACNGIVVVVHDGGSRRIE